MENAALSAYGPCADPALACTIAVSGPAEAQREAELEAEGKEGEGAEVKGSLYLTAAADGSRAIFAAKGALYEARIEADGEGRLTAHDSQIAAGYAGFLGASEDARRLYFASGEALTGANGEGRSPSEGDPNLYYYDADRPAGERLAFIGTLSGQDADEQSKASPLAYSPVYHAARVSPDGLTAAFESSAPLSGYDNTDRRSGRADVEVFRYDAGAGGLACVSCNPSGQRPLGEDTGRKGGSFWVAGQIPGAFNQMHAPRALSADGRRLFFDSFDSLVAADGNGAADVYEWEAPGEGGCAASSPAYAPTAAGCIYLISSGADPEDSTFLDADPSGANVFFTTLAGLVPSDPGLIDVYDAREGGGQPPPGAPPAPCQGEACQSPPPPPSRPTPATAAPAGEGNVVEVAGRRCTAPARRAARLAHRARALRRGARRMIRRGGPPRKAHRLGRRARRFAHRAQRTSKAAKHCRRRARRSHR